MILVVDIVQTVLVLFPTENTTGCDRQFRNCADSSRIVGAPRARTDLEAGDLDLKSNNFADEMHTLSVNRPSRKGAVRFKDACLSTLSARFG
jgi:hypothetical protein